MFFIAACTTRSFTVGMPRGRNFPGWPGFGMSTRRTGLGRYAPERSSDAQLCDERRRPLRRRTFLTVIPSTPAVRRPLIAGDAREGDPQVARVGNQPPQLAEDVVGLVPTSRVQLPLLAPEPAPCRAGSPHTWLSPAASRPYSSTASLRHVRGSPALGLLRRLRPSSETSPDLAACRASRARRSDRGSRVHRRNPWCGRWSALPLAARTARRLRDEAAACPCGHTQSLHEIATGLWLHSRRAASSCSVQRLPTPTSSCADVRPRVLHHGTCGSPPRTHERLCGQFRPLGCCRPPFQSRRRSRPPSSSGPTRTRMTSFLGHRSLLRFMAHVLVQKSRTLSELRGTADGGASGAPGGPHSAGGADSAIRACRSRSSCRCSRRPSPRCFARSRASTPRSSRATTRAPRRRAARPASFTRAPSRSCRRFGSSLNLHVHLHTCALDGVYVEGDDGTRRASCPRPLRAARSSTSSPSAWRSG